MNTNTTDQTPATTGTTGNAASDAVLNLLRAMQTADELTHAEGVAAAQGNTSIMSTPNPHWKAIMARCDARKALQQLCRASAVSYGDAWSVYNDEQIERAGISATPDASPTMRTLASLGPEGSIPDHLDPSF